MGGVCAWLTAVVAGPRWYPMALVFGSGLFGLAMGFVAGRR